FTGELFEADATERELIKEGVAVDPASLRRAWSETIGGVVREATLQAPASSWMQTGGRGGRHSEHLGHLLSELHYLQRTYPGAGWCAGPPRAQKIYASSPGVSPRKWSTRRSRS